MAAETQTLQRAGHPSPHRDRVALPGLMFGLWAGPIAWVTQLVVNYALAVYPCFAAGSARASVLPAWQWEGALLLVVNLAAAVLSIAGAILSLRHWLATREEHPGALGHAIEAGEGRTRFLALCGLMTGFGFLVAILFDTIGLLMVPQCAG